MTEKINQQEIVCPPAFLDPFSEGSDLAGRSDDSIFPAFLQFSKCGDRVTLDIFGPQGTRQCGVCFRDEMLRNMRFVIVPDNARFIPLLEQVHENRMADAAGRTLFTHFKIAVPPIESSGRSRFRTRNIIITANGQAERTFPAGFCIDDGSQESFPIRDHPNGRCRASHGTNATTITVCRQPNVLHIPALSIESSLPSSVFLPY